MSSLLSIRHKWNVISTPVFKRYIFEANLMSSYTIIENYQSRFQHTFRNAFKPLSNQKKKEIAMNLGRPKCGPWAQCSFRALFTWPAVLVSGCVVYAVKKCLHLHQTAREIPGFRNLKMPGTRKDMLTRGRLNTNNFGHPWKMFGGPWSKL